MRNFIMILAAVSYCRCASQQSAEGQPEAPPSTSSSTPDSDRPDAPPSPNAAARNEGVGRPPARPFPFPKVAAPDFELPRRGAMVSIPAGTLRAGSAPFDRARTDYAESDLIHHEMTAFEIDALPYPNDPARPFLTGISRDEARNLCEEQGKRLCTELEWERACKSDDNRRFPYGNRYRSAAYPEEEPHRPASPFGVFAMGRLREWTDSAWGTEPDQVERTAVRGWAEGLGLAPERGRRCAQRWPGLPGLTEPTLGFRCCRGAKNEAICRIERPRPPFSVYKTMKPEEFAAVIRSIPELGAVHDNPHMFSDGDIRAVLARRENDRKELAEQGVRFLWKPMRWIPRQGMELLVAVGRSNRHAFIVALHETKNNEEYAHASSLILFEEPIPLALAYLEGHRDEMYWAPCWGCRDGGKITFDDKTNQVIITHKW